MKIIKVTESQAVKLFLAQTTTIYPYSIFFFVNDTETSPHRTLHCETWANNFSTFGRIKKGTIWRQKVKLQIPFENLKKSNITQLLIGAEFNSAW